MEHRLKCLDCQQSKLYKDEKELEAHIAADHMHIFEFGCKTCKHGRFPTAYAMSDHQLVVHKDHSLPDCHLYEYPGDTRMEALKKRVEECVAGSKQPEVVDLTQEVVIIAEKSIGSVKCLYCEQSVVFNTMEKLEAHIAEDHLKSFPFRCSKCPFVRFPTEYILRCHHNEDHQTTEFELIMNHSTEIYNKRLEVTMKVVQCLQARGKAPEVKKPRNRKKPKTADSSVVQNPAVTVKPDMPGKSIDDSKPSGLPENPISNSTPPDILITEPRKADPSGNSTENISVPVTPKDLPGCSEAGVSSRASISKQSSRPKNSGNRKLKRGASENGESSAPPAKRAMKGTSESPPDLKEETVPSELPAPIAPSSHTDTLESSSTPNVQPMKVENPKTTAKAPETLVECRKQPSIIECVRYAFVRGACPSNSLNVCVGKTAQILNPAPQRSHKDQGYPGKIQNPYEPVNALIPAQKADQVSNGTHQGYPEKIHNPYMPINPYVTSSGVSSVPVGQSRPIDHTTVAVPEKTVMNPAIPPEQFDAQNTNNTGKRPGPVEKAELYGHVITSWLKNPIKIEELPEHSRIQLLAAFQAWTNPSPKKLRIEQNAPKLASKPDPAPIGIRNPYKNPYDSQDHPGKIRNPYEPVNAPKPGQKSDPVSKGTHQEYPVEIQNPYMPINPYVTPSGVSLAPTWQSRAVAVPEKTAMKSNALAEHGASSTIIEQYIPYLQSYQNIAPNPEAPQMGYYCFPWK